jgi:hypothetical protein
MQLLDPTKSDASPLAQDQWLRGLGTLRLRGCGEGVVWAGEMDGGVSVPGDVHGLRALW